VNDVRSHDESFRQSIEDYYEETFVDYRALWINSENRALHMGFWDESVDDHAQSLLRANQVLAEHAGIAPGQRVLDAGCGLGGAALWLNRTFGVEVVGVTVSHDQVIRARRYAKEAGVQDAISFEQLDYADTGMESDSFDTLWAQESFCHAVDKPKAVEEFHRVLRPGGTVAICDFFPVEAMATARGDDLMAQWLDGWRMPHLATRAQAETMLQEAGFVDVEFTDTTDWIRPSFLRLYRLTMYFRPALWLMERRGLRSPLQIGNTVGSRAAHQALRRKLWQGGIIVARKPA